MNRSKKIYLLDSTRGVEEVMDRVARVLGADLAVVRKLAVSPKRSEKHREKSKEVGSKK